MSDKKTLNIDPNLFSFSNGNISRKKRNPDNKIKVKTPSQKKQNDTLKKKSILKMIRQHQEDRYKNMFEPKSTTTTITHSNSTVDSFNKDFQEAKLFLENLTEKNKQADKLKNYTIKNQPNSLANVTQSVNSVMQPLATVAENVTNLISPTVLNNPMHLTAPKYGCLKNGTLPTFRNFMNTTQKNYAQIGGATPNITVTNSMPNMNSMPNAPSMHNSMPNMNSMPNITQTGGAPDIMKQKINDSIARINMLNESAAKLKELKKQMRPKQKKQKKTFRRTYKIGKSKVFPRVSVLVSNKTLRNNITTKSQLLKQTSMSEVKKYLIKHGLIRVGSIAPNDVLRQMYESSMLVCGEIQNHNPDNLLYNFLNGSDE